MARKETERMRGQVARAVSESIQILRRMEMFAGSVEELVNWCLQRGLDPAVVSITGTHIRWESPQTEQEAAAHAAYQAKTLARHEAWERETYARLREKFGVTE